MAAYIVRIDAKDARILALVQGNNRLTAEQIGDVVGLSHTGVVRRLKRLRDRAVITADVALVSAEAVGYPVRVNVTCSIERGNDGVLDRFREALRSDPLVITADSVLGEADFTFTLVARSMEHLRELVRSYRSSFPSLRNVTSLVVLEEVKRGPVIPGRAERPIAQASVRRGEGASERLREDGGSPSDQLPRDLLDFAHKLARAPRDGARRLAGREVQQLSRCT